MMNTNMTEKLVETAMSLWNEEEAPSPKDMADIFRMLATADLTGLSKHLETVRETQNG